MSIVHLVDMRSGQTLVSYVLPVDDPTEEQVDLLERVVEAFICRELSSAMFCRHMIY